MRNNLKIELWQIEKLTEQAIDNCQIINENYKKILIIKSKLSDIKTQIKDIRKEIENV